MALTEKKILEIKKKKKIKSSKSKFIKIIKFLKIKFALFFILSFFLLGLFLYYITCFCGIYVNTQTHLIKDSVISFVLSFVYPFGILLIPGIFRMPALHAKNKDKEYLYKLSQFIQNLV